MRFLCVAFAAALVVSGCTRATSSPALPAAAGARTAPSVKGAQKITHVVFIVQENRTFDSIFGGPNPFPGADAATGGKMSNGNNTPLTKVTIENPIGNGDPNNYHFQWLKACNAPAGSGPPFKVGQPSPCRMNGFDLNAKQQNGYPGPPGDSYKGSLQYIYSYVDRKESAPYWFIAKHYAVGDRFFMGHNSESFTAHQYIFSSQSRNMVDSPVFPKTTSCSIYYDYCAYTPWGCDSPAGTRTYSLNSMTGSWNGGPPTSPDGPAPCFGKTNPYLSMAELAQKKNVSWRLYAYSMCSGIVGLDVNYALRNSSAWPNKSKMSQCHSDYGLETPLEAGSAHFRAPQYDFLVDEVPPGSGGRALTNITWILPGAYTSDHPGVPGGYCGPSWVAKVINAIGSNTADWNSTAIFVIWDDWGGFYDHVPPYVVRDQAGPGFRVPLLVVSPYVRTGAVVHTNTEFATLNKFVETTFGLGTLGATDASPYLNDLDGFFNFNQQPQKFTPIPDPGYSGCSYLGGDAMPPPPNASKSRWLRMVGHDGDGDGDGD